MNRESTEVSVESDDLQFELVASSLRADTGDLKAFIEALAVKLEGALPGRARVERKGDGLFSRTKHVYRIAVEFGENRYEIIHSAGQIQATVGKAVRGIVLKTEHVSLDEWIDQLSRDLTAEANRSEQSRLALQRLLGA